MDSNVFLYNGQDESEVPRNITHLRCDSSVTEIPKSLFEGCRHLVTVELNEGLKRIGYLAFTGCESLRNINFPSTLEVIGDHAFHDCPSLTSINLPSTLEEIGDGAFYYCESLVTAELNEGLKVIGGEAFYECASLKSINFPSTLEEIGDDAFYNCKGLVTVELNEGLKKIGKYAFMMCTWLRNINFPSTLEKIGEGAFSGCKRLVSVELPEGLEEIEDGAFADCEDLRNLFIPSTVNKIGSIFTDTLGSIFTDSYNGISRPPKNLANQFPVDDIDDCRLLMNALKTRFDGLPIHRLCYFQSHHPTATTLESLAKLVSSKDISYERCDVFGMTPFHILALSAKPNMDLFWELLKHYPTNVLTQNDMSGYFPIEYLLEHKTSDVNSMVKHLLVDRIKWLGLERWRAAVMNEIQNFPEGFERLIQRQIQLSVIYSALVKYERFEVLSLLEEFLWSMKIDEAKSTESDLSCGEEKKKKKAKIYDNSDKQAYRINSGADIVISNVLPYLGTYYEEDSSEDDEEESTEGEEEGDSSSDGPDSESEGGSDLGEYNQEDSSEDEETNEAESEECLIQ